MNINILLVSLKARKKAASNYSMNTNMAIEESLLTEQIEALEKYQKGNKNFLNLLKDFEECAIRHAESGGGHPADIPLKKKDYEESKKEIIDYVKGLLC